MRVDRVFVDGGDGITVFVIRYGDVHGVDCFLDAPYTSANRRNVLLPKFQHGVLQQVGIKLKNKILRTQHDPVFVCEDRATGVDRGRKTRHPHQIAVTHASVEERRREHCVGHGIDRIDIVLVPFADHVFPIKLLVFIS